jgi:hypothetical protein
MLRQLAHARHNAHPFRLAHPFAIVEYRGSPAVHFAHPFHAGDLEIASIASGRYRGAS